MAEKARRVLVTGASGFIGGACLQLLDDQGYELHCVASGRGFGNGPSSDHKASWHRVDLLDGAQTASLVEHVRPTHLLHCAWVATPGSFWHSEANLDWLASSVGLVRRFYALGGERAVGVGTCAEYAWGDADCTEAETPLRPETVYGQCKAAAYLAFQAAASSAGATAGWARLFFPYGPGEAPDRLIATVIRGLLNDERVACTHGNQIRDFVFVADVARALVALLESDAGGAFNVASGEGFTLREVVDLICHRLESAGEVAFGARPVRPGDPRRVVADIGRIREEVGWEPQCGIEAGIDSAIAAWRRSAGQDRKRAG